MSAYDASYVTLGALLDIAVISADRKVISAARDAGVGAWTPTTMNSSGYSILRADPCR